MSIVHSEKITRPSETAFIGVLFEAGMSTPKCFWLKSNWEEIFPLIGRIKTYSTFELGLSKALNLSSFSTMLLSKES